MTAPLPVPALPRERHLLPAVAPLLPPQAAERERLPALMPWPGRQVGRLMLEWPGSLPPEQVWEVQTEE